MLQTVCFLVAVVLFSTVERAEAQGWIAIKTFQNSFPANCNQTQTGAQAHLTNYCIKDTFTTGSSMYNYSSASPTQYFVNYYQTIDCTGSATVFEYDLNTCDSGQYATYSDSQPQFSGELSFYSSSCGGSPFRIDVSFYNVCQYGSQSVYNGGKRCVRMSYQNNDCTGDIRSVYSDSGSSCSANVTRGCGVNGKFLPEDYAAPSKSNTVVASKYYSNTGCLGSPIATAYGLVNYCDGDGTKINVVGNKIQRTLYDNADCTGTAYNEPDDSDDDDDILGQCQAGYRQTSTSTEISKFPTGTVKGFGLVYKDKCINPSVLYVAYVYSEGCANVNINSSQTVSCSSTTTPQGAVNITYTLSTYGTPDCTGNPVAAETDYVPGDCEEDGPYQFYSYSCGFTFPGGFSSDSSLLLVSTLSLFLFSVVAVVF